MKLTNDERRRIFNAWFIWTREHDPENLNKTYNEIVDIDKRELDIPPHIVNKHKD